MDITDVTVNTRLRGIRAFFNYCMKMGYIPRFEMELIRTEKKIKEVYTDEEIKLLIKKPKQKCLFTEYRNWVITLYLIATGNRLRTIINIKNGDVDINNQVIMLKKTKNHKQQIFPISDYLKPILKEYMMKRKGKEDDFLFCNQYGEQLTSSGLSQSIRKYNRRRGVTKTSIHLYRHTFARRLIQNGAELYDLKCLLGHSTLQMSTEYLDEFSPKVMNGYKEFDPLKNIIKHKMVI